MTIEDMLVGADQIKDKNGQKKIKSYVRFEEAIERIKMVEWVKENIDKKNGGIIVVKISDVLNEMGPEFTKYHYATVYQALKCILFDNGILMKVGTHKDGGKVFILREKKPEDKLAPSYYVRAKKECNIIDKLREKKLEIIRDRTTLDIDIKKERDNFYEEKRVMYEEIEKLKQELKNISENGTYMVEVFKINWKTLEWKMIKGKIVRTDVTLLGMIRQYSSTPNERYRIEVTQVDNIPEMCEGAHVQNADDVSPSIIEVPDGLIDSLDNAKIGCGQNA